VALEQAFPIWFGVDIPTSNCLPENTPINSFLLFDMTGKEKRLAPFKNQN
jgi:hypothetical protein